MPIRFPEYCRFEALRVRVDDSMEALIVAARIAATHLGTLPQDQYLTELFPQLEGMQRLHRTSTDAQRIIDRAAVDFTWMAIPFVVSIYEAFLNSCTGILLQAGVASTDQLDTPIRLQDVHQKLSAIGLHLESDDVELFGFVRRIRNRLVHTGATQGRRLETVYSRLHPSAKAEWKRLTGRRPQFSHAQDRLAFDHRELRAALAVTHRLAEVVAEELEEVVPRAYWAAVVVSDFYATFPTMITANPQIRLKKVIGLAHHLYGSLALTEGELIVALDKEPLEPAEIKDEDDADDRETPKGVEVGTTA